MARATAVTVGTSPTLLTADSPSVAVQAYAIVNVSAVTVWIGGSDITVTAGYPIPAGESLGADLRNMTDELYGIVASGTAELRVLRLETGQT